MRSGPDAPAQPPSPTCFSSADEEDLPAVAVPRACPPYVYCTQARNVEEIHIPEIILVAKRLWIGIKLRGAVARHNSFVDEDKNTQLTTHNRIGGQFPSTCVSVDSRNDRCTGKTSHLYIDTGIFFHETTGQRVTNDRIQVQIDHGFAFGACTFDQPRSIALRRIKNPTPTILTRRFAQICHHARR